MGRNFGGGKNDEKTVVSAVASAGDAYPSKEGFREDSLVGQIQHARTHGMGRRIEPAEPEPPPAHPLGRIDKDVMGRSGQLVQTCW